MVGLAMLTDLAVVGGLSIPPLSIAFASHVEISFCGLEAKLRKNIALRVLPFRTSRLLQFACQPPRHRHSKCYRVDNESRSIIGQAVLKYSISNEASKRSLADGHPNKA